MAKKIAFLEEFVSQRVMNVTEFMSEKEKDFVLFKDEKVDRGEFSELQR